MFNSFWEEPVTNLLGEKTVPGRLNSKCPHVCGVCRTMEEEGNEVTTVLRSEILKHSEISLLGKANRYASNIYHTLPQ